MVPIRASEIHRQPRCLRTNMHRGYWLRSVLWQWECAVFCLSLSSPLWLKSGLISHPSDGASPRLNRQGMGGPVLVWCLHCLLLLGPWDLAEDKSPNPLGAGSAGAHDARSLALGQRRVHRRLKRGRDRFVTGLHVQRSVKKNPRWAAQCGCASPCWNSSWCLFTLQGRACC